MELERLCTRLNNMPNSIRRAYTKDITNIVEDLFFEYDIKYKNTEHDVPKDIFLRRLVSIFGDDHTERVKICKGISQNGNKCCRRVTDDSDFCKTHSYLAYRQTQSRGQAHVQSPHVSVQDDVFVVQNTGVKNVDVANLQTRMVDGTFYLTDSSFVYDKTSLERVGYIEGDRCILTDDPFILCL